VGLYKFLRGDPRFADAATLEQQAGKAQYPGSSTTSETAERGILGDAKRRARRIAA
jgi:hypothetical protein